MSDKWRGIGKLIEESGEVNQVCGKLLIFPSGKHPDGGPDLSSRITLEIADLYAALDYFVSANGLDQKMITMCRHQKLEKFRYWDLPGVKT